VLSVIAAAAIFGSVILIVLVGAEAVRSYRRQYLEQAEEKVEALYLHVSPARLWLLAMVGAAGGGLLLALVTGFKLVPAVLGAVGGFMAPRVYIRIMEQRRRKKLDAQLLDAITVVAGAMKAGMSLLQALEQVTREMGAPIRQEFAHALQENRVGKPIIQALQDMKNRLGSEDLSVTVDAISIAQETGGVLSDVLVKIAETIRRRNQIRGKITSLTASGKLQGIVMSLLPWGLAGILTLVAPELIRPMFTTTLGQILLVIIGVLELAGYVVIRRMVAVDV
jgi:tight adherence protein B